MYGFSTGYRGADDMMLDALYQQGSNICKSGRRSFVSGYPANYPDGLLSPNKRYNQKDRRNKFLLGAGAIVLMCTKVGRGAIGLLMKGVKALF